jgi:DNA-binding winged helix-turn-helix (wHTH) protein
MDQEVMETQLFNDAVVMEPDVRRMPTELQDGMMCFAGFRVLPGSRTLLADNEVVPLGSRAFDLLLVLLRSRGRVVTKQEIVRAVWPSTFVDESNLRFQVGVLRKALGPERARIKTIPGRGYLFAEEAEIGLARIGRMEAIQPRTGQPHPDGSGESIIFVIEPDADERDALASLLRALKVKVLSFGCVDDVAAFAGSPL